ncbi:DUF3999 family protein [Marinilabiliaceae bacterium JC017]|nr:DUF3999 family protein [Marinilabiliaceae bacterium JC017]
MKMQSNSWICLLLLLCPYTYGQIDHYNFKRELPGITNTWHKITLPDEIFGKVQPSLQDIRIFGITANNDTLEAPYLLRLTKGVTAKKEVNFKRLNTSKNGKGYYFTFEIPSNEPINQIHLDFQQEDFDWRLTLEGSQNQQEWFTIVEDGRILSIKNKLTDYQFTNVTFPDARYRYFRLLINSKEKPILLAAKTTLNETTEARYRTYPLQKMRITENKKAKETVIDVDLNAPVPVSYLKIDVGNSFDYYRPVSIKYCADSTKTEKGWIYHYHTLTSGILNSIENNTFKCNSTILQKLKLIIHNDDNAPLTINTIEAKGYLHELTARFTQPATYFLTYGNKTAGKPRYDINRLTGNIPDSLSALIPGAEQMIEKRETITKEPLFKNKNWLWAIMAGIIALLGWFSFKMLRNN